MKLSQMYEIVMTFSLLCLYNPPDSKYYTKLPLTYKFIFDTVLPDTKSFSFYFTLFFNFYSIFNRASCTVVYL